MPFGEMVVNRFMWVLTLMKDWVWPFEGEYVWVRAPALILSMVWMIWIIPKPPEGGFTSSQKFFNQVGGWVAATLFFVAVVGIVLWPITAAWNYLGIHWIWKCIILAILYWLMGSILKWIGGLTWTGVKKVFEWAKAIPAHAKANPNVVYMAFGTLFAAGLLTGEKVTMLTEDVLPGIIPGISGAVGIVVGAIRSKQIWADLLMFAKRRVHKNGDWTCLEKKSDGKGCKTVNAKGSDYCKSCGKRWAYDTWDCNCGKMDNGFEAVVCPICGDKRSDCEKLPGRKIGAPRPGVVGTPSPNSSPRPAPAAAAPISAQPMKSCGRCGADNPVTHKFCRTCNEKFDEATSPAVPKPVVRSAYGLPEEPGDNGLFSK